MCFPSNIGNTAVAPKSCEYYKAEEHRVWRCDVKAGTKQDMWNGTLLWQNLGCRRELLRRRTVSPHVSLWILTLAMGTALQVPLLGFSFPSYKQSKLVTSQRACSDPRNLSCPVALTNCLTSARHPLFPLSSCSSCPAPCQSPLLEKSPRTSRRVYSHLPLSLRSLPSK